MQTKPRSTAIYSSPFCKQDWIDAASELTSTRMLVITALLTAMRIALKPLAIPLGNPQLTIQVATLATALGAMVFGPVVAIPAALVSDTIGFLIWPTGDYFLPFALTEIAGTVIYALFLYRANVSTVRVMLARFSICFFVNCVLQQFILAWQYSYMGNPEEAKDAVLGIMNTARIFKNLAFFPIESVVLTLFLKALVPVTQRVKLTFCTEADFRFGKKQIVSLVCLMLVGVVASGCYLGYRYNRTSRTADYSTKQRVAANKAMAELVLERTDDWDDEKVFCVVDSAYRPLFGKETDYTVAVYILDEEAFAKGQAANEKYTEDTLWAYKKSGPKNDKYGSLVKVASVSVQKNERTGEILTFDLKPVS